MTGLVCAGVGQVDRSVRDRRIGGIDNVSDDRSVKDLGIRVRNRKSEQSDTRENSKNVEFPHFSFHLQLERNWKETRK